jgi:hypothetical protein
MKFQDAAGEKNFRKNLSKLLILLADLYNGHSEKGFESLTVGLNLNGAAMKYHSTYRGVLIYQGGALGWFAVQPTRLMADTLQGIKELIRKALAK